MITAVFLALVVLLVFALAVALGDRVCLGLAERKASEYLGQPSAIHRACACTAPCS